MSTKDGSEFTVFYLQDTGYGPTQVLKIVDDAGVDVSTGKYVGGGDDKGWMGKSIKASMEDLEFIVSSALPLDMPLTDPPHLQGIHGESGPIGPKGDIGWQGEQEAYAGEMILPEDMVRGRLYKVEGVGMVARFMDEYDDFLFKMRHHEVVFYIPMDAKVRKIGKSEIDEYLS